ncbi:hypothetical protein ES708_17070 [subsurface metagenome]
MTEYRKLGDSLRADKIVASARRVSTSRISRRTSKHKGQFIDLRDNAFCTIDIPLRAELERKS